MRQILENSSMDCFEWRPYTKTVKNLQFPKFCPEKEMWVPVGPDLDDEFISFARCIKPIEDLTLFIPSRSAIPRVTSMFCEWWRKLFPQLHHSLKEKGVGDAYDDTYTSDSKRQKLFHENNESSVVSSHNDEGDESSLKAAKVNDEKFGVGDASEPLCKKCRLEADDNYCSGLASVRADVDKADREQRKETDVTGSKAGKRIVLSPCDERNPSHPPSALGGAMGIVVSPVETTKSCDDELDVCGSNVEKMTMIDYIQIKQRNEGNDETGSRTGKDMDMSANDENNTSDPPLGFDDATQDILVSPPPGTRQTCDDEIDVHGRNVEKMSMPDDGSKEPECLLHKDGGMAGEKASSEKKENDSLIQKKIASNADNNEPTLCQNLAPGGSEVAGESNKGKAVGDETQGHDCLFHHTVLGSEETMKSRAAPSIEKLALSIDERIAKAERNVAWLKARKAAKLKKIAAAAARLI
ncbi:hypothetical protein DY000_02059186 [Brassica cretica]|uniref:Aminotransferase-like plant mobile domain-containing protein n=1 Tax=Brassica cretica TaxID=69181 RepID=A0ABQ7ANI8_BRACR|nr:hypothetical protein DY000_02059186 [Brassica cretica]